MEIFQELLMFAKERKKLVLLPLILILFLLGGLLFVSSGTVVAPFIYTLF